MDKKINISEDIISGLTQEAVGVVELSDDALQTVAGGWMPVPPTGDPYVVPCM